MVFASRSSRAPTTVEKARAPRVAGASRRMLDLLPIPAAVVTYGDGGWRFEAVNNAFRCAGLGSRAENSPLIAQLGARVARFLASEDKRDEFAWQLGDAIDCREYRVTLARTALGARDRCLATLIDQTSQSRTEQSLRREMASDTLTGLLNRGGFSDRLDALAGDPDALSRHAVLIVDLDRFSRVNACLGSLAGDELLITLARRLKGVLRGRDLLARTGGDEFGILLTLDDGRQDAMKAAARIEAALAAPFRLSDFEIRMGVSIGIAFGSDCGQEVEDLVRHAQFAVKRSKKSGVAETYHPRAFDLAREQLALETELRCAIEEDRLRLSFQPICDLVNGRIIAFEALARWTDDRGVEHYPSDFIPVAEETGLIVALGRWAIDSAAATLAEWDRRAGGDCAVKLAVNLSAIQLQRDDIAPVVERALRRHGLDGSCFTLELTESALVTDPDRIAATMRDLKALGTTLAMDDFGTGYSNLAYLQKLPIDILKIDRSLVTGMLGDRDKVAIVRAILSLAQALGMSTTAEGIETQELGQTLTALGCTFGQGYAFARPLPADEAYSLLIERNA